MRLLRITAVAALVITVAAVAGCGARGDRRGLEYMPDMGLAALRQLCAEPSDPGRKTLQRPGTRHDCARLPAAALHLQRGRRRAGRPRARNPVPRTDSARRPTARCCSRPSAPSVMAAGAGRWTDSPQASPTPPAYTSHACAACPRADLPRHHLRVGQDAVLRRQLVPHDRWLIVAHVRRCSGRSAADDAAISPSTPIAPRRVARWPPPVCSPSRRAGARSAAHLGQPADRRSLPAVPSHSAGIVFIALQYLCGAGWSAASGGCPRR